MKKHILFAIFSLSLIPGEGIAQVFLNLDFEYGVYKSQPRKWAIEGEGEMYDARLDSSMAENGNKSLHIRLKNGAVYTFLSLPGKLIAGKIKSLIFYNSTDCIWDQSVDGITVIIAPYKVAI